MGFDCTFSEVIGFARADLDEFRVNDLSMHHAMRAVLSCNHLPEHLYHAAAKTAPLGMSVDDFRKMMRKSCPAFDRVADAANLSKHVVITRYTPSVKAVKRKRLPDENAVALALVGLGPTGDDDLDLVLAFKRNVPTIAMIPQSGDPIPLLQDLEEALSFITKKAETFSLI